ncbi:MAG: thioredoxin-dependent thiol peroxidase [Gemmatimonadetes bacterium]|nr:thioredoxin-dependent thiol peroxidase [Gemmatimonadota bacterium]
MLAENDVAPDFTLPAEDGSTVRLSDLRGRKVVLYFYPKDDTPGCTRQACDLRDRFAQLEAEAVVLGVSPDPVEAHVRFRKKYGLPFRLLVDSEHRVAEAYGVWKEKSFLGRKHWGNERSTFVIDEQGRVARVFPRVKPEEHASLVLEALRGEADAHATRRRPAR